ncbi:hypothetical protein F0562_033900 [Nyssa sinensis]|uniref:Protein kinase domain-containing protein n=1 Tax=Nyssa sinensis TaxID=561372 RepID=A0A5J5AJF6_9ASTE|nr:hypothetical protein F0562_033900 [Nyssa sinensis]
MDPEYYRRRKLTVKSDVYSFGVVLFEVLCGRPAVKPMGVEEECEDEERVGLADWARHCHQTRTIDRMIDPYLRGKIVPECSTLFVDVAVKCLADKGIERPTMSEVLVAILAEQSPYEPADNQVLDCGTSTAILPSNGQRWNPRYSYKFSKELNPTTVSRASIQDSGDLKFPTLNACIFHKQFTYTFPVSAGMHFIRLHFYPATYARLNISEALFSVTVGPYTLLSTSEESYSMDASAIEYIVKEFCINVDGSLLNITFTPWTNSSDAYGFVNNIEILSMHPNLYIPEDHVAVPFIGHPSKFLVNYSTALEMMYRLNVGGRFIHADDDTGMFRVWFEDEPFLVVGNGYTVHSKLNIIYSSSVPAYTAPRQVYATARTISYYNLQWSFPLEYGFYYLIRLHFCEIRRGITQKNESVFRIYIDNQTAEDHADVVQWSDGIGVPVYRDYVVNLSRYSHKIPCLFLELQKITEGAILNGLEIFKLSDHRNNLAGLYPFRSSNAKYEKSCRQSMAILTMKKILYGFIVSAILILMVYYAFWLCPVWLRPSSLLSLLRYSKWQRRTFMQWATQFDHCRYFSLAEIKLATNNFLDANLIGAGGFGKVYQGCIDGGATTVAIKRGSPTSHQGLHEFQTEITMLSKLRHRHLVSLIGCCMDDKEMILVYDFMARGTLRDHLYNTENPALPWKKRLKICIDAARGLQYLHSGTKQTIIHRDVKTSNILLGKNWVAKIADFGLSKVGPNMSHTHVSTIVKGSFGYLDPEYYRRQKLTEKSDVYSFGVVLFEVLCARPAVLPMELEEDEELEQANLAQWALHCHQMGTLDQIIDPCLRGKIDPECFKTFTEIAKKCLADRGNERPSMSDLLWELELAWQQQECADVEREERACGGRSRRIADEVAMMINDGQRSHCIGNSDPTPGAEFSDLMAPIGR